MKKQDKELNLGEYPSIHYKKFFDRFQEINTLPIDEWRTLHIISYFCENYEKIYNVKYSFKFNSPSPSKSYEVYQINKLASMLSSNPNVLKDYLDWFFQNKIILKKKRITSMAFLTDTNTVNEFKFKVVLSPTVDRSTKIQNKFLDVVKKYDPDIFDYGKLAFIKKCIDAGGADDYIKMFEELKAVGFDQSVLDKVK